MNHLKHSSNFQLLGDVQAKHLDHFHTQALKLSDNFTPLYAAYFLNHIISQVKWF